MSTRRTVAILVAAIAFTGAIATPAQALPTSPTANAQPRSVADDPKPCFESAPFDDPSDPESGLCPIPVLGITDSTTERPPCENCTEGGGIIVNQLDKDGAAYKGGIRKHDTIVGFSNKKGTDAETLFTDPDALIAGMAEHKAGDVLTFRIWSNEGGRYTNAKVTLPASH